MLIVDIVTPLKMSPLTTQAFTSSDSAAHMGSPTWTWALTPSQCYFLLLNNFSPPYSNIIFLT